MARARPYATAVVIVAACGGDVVALADDDTTQGDATQTSAPVPEPSTTDASDTTAADESGSDESGFAPVDRCGNGVLDLGEACDDAKDGDNDDECTDLCAPPTCGDGFVQASLFEHCDAGPSRSADCTPSCTATVAPAWTFELTSDIGNSSVLGVAIDGAGNIVAVGTFGTTHLGSDAWIAKLDPSGRQLWSHTFTSEGLHADDQAADVAIAPNGDIVTGGDIGSDVWLGRFAPDGELIWMNVHDLGIDEFDAIEAIALGDDGAIYAGGRRGSTGLWYARYTAGGEQVWSIAEGTADPFDRIYSIDARGTTVVIGGVLDQDALVRKLDTDGNELWNVAYNASPTPLDMVSDVHIDADGSIYVLGTFELMYLRKLDAAGREIWTRVYEDEGHSASGFAFADDAIYVAGTDRVFAYGRSAAVRKLTLDGDEIWRQLYDDGKTLSGANAIAIQGSTIALAGWLDQGSPGNKGFVRLLTP